MSNNRTFLQIQLENLSIWLTKLVIGNELNVYAVKNTEE